jgi:uncharacterized protein YbaR (Trm112 family)
MTPGVAEDDFLLTCAGANVRQGSPIALPIALSNAGTVMNTDPAVTPADAGYALDPKLLELLVCPVTKGTLEYDREKHELISRSARLAYPIRDGIPIMLADEARPLDESEVGKR